MQGSSVVLALALVVLTADARLRRKEDPAPSEATTKCVELCKTDSGMDADSNDCLTECAVSTDLHTHHLDAGIRHFVKDEAHNEKGGKKMQEAHNEKAPLEVLGCTPEVDLKKAPDFKDLDTNGDGVIDAEESLAWNEKACVPDEMSEQIFHQADTNQDKVIDKSEWKEAGEDTKHEQAMDKALEKVSEGDDEYNPVQNPPFKEFDHNDDGALDESEQKDAFKHEVGRRSEHRYDAVDDLPKDAQKDLEPEVQDAIDTVDTDDDGKISEKEYTEKDGDGSDLGQEYKEAADADEDSTDVDDLSRVDAGAPAPAAFLETKSRKLREHHKMQ